LIDIELILAKVNNDLKLNPQPINQTNSPKSNDNNPFPRASSPKASSETRNSTASELI
jgi:hypothetical protein